MHNAMIARQGRKFSRHDLQLFCSPLGYSRNIVVTPGTIFATTAGNALKKTITFFMSLPPG